MELSDSMPEELWRYDWLTITPVSELDHRERPTLVIAIGWNSLMVGGES
jgi:hypothetical protein